MSPHDVDGYKMLHETLKQLVTVSTGSIVIVNAFLGKLAFPLLKVLVSLAFTGFLICIIASLFLMRNISWNVKNDRSALEIKDRRNHRIAEFSFLSAISALVLFVIASLFNR